jgi:ribosome-associated protein
MADPVPDASRQWALAAARAAAAKTDEPTVVLDVGDVLAITGWFVITGGRNTRLVRSLAEEIEEQVVAAGGPKPLRVEGMDVAQWVLLDYGDLIVHVFLDEAREFYDLERLWRDVPSIDWRAEPDGEAGSDS